MSCLLRIFLLNKFKRINPEKYSENKMLLHPIDGSNCRDDLEATGGQCVALGVDAKIIPTGRCKRGNVTKETKDFVTTPLNIDKPIGNACIFNKCGECYFDGRCEDKIYRVKVKKVTNGLR